MGFFDDANDKFCEDVKKAWDELWADDDDDDDDADDDDGEDDHAIGLGDIFSRKPWLPVPDGGSDPIKRMSDVLDTIAAIGGTVGLHNPVGKLLSGATPVPGTPVYCKLAVVAEHTGIYVGDDEIVHLNGDGEIETVSPREFVSRLDGLNPAVSIYFAAGAEGKALGKRSVANRARSMVGGRRNYDLFFDNCHQFTCGCLSGDFENLCKLFPMVEMEIMKELGFFHWAEWDY